MSRKHIVRIHLILLITCHSNPSLGNSDLLPDGFKDSSQFIRPHILLEPSKRKKPRLHPWFPGDKSSEPLAMPEIIGKYTQSPQKQNNGILHKISLESIQNSKPTRPIIPAISSASETTISAKKGAAIQLSLKTVSGSIEIFWVHQNQSLCNQTNCTIKTEKWSTGAHKLELVIINSQGMVGITYSINILPLSGFGSTVTPKIVQNPKLDYQLSFSDSYVLAKNGIGFARTLIETTLVKKIARKLSWNSDLRTDATGVLQFGRKGHIESYLLPKSSIRLTKRQDLSIISLAEGQIRLRLLDEKKVKPVIIIEDWLQINFLGKTDLIVERRNKGNKIYSHISVLKGEIQVVYKPPIRYSYTNRTPFLIENLSRNLYRSEKGTIKLEARAGTSLTVGNILKNPIVPTLSPHRGMISLFNRTTPEYFFATSWLPQEQNSTSIPQNGHFFQGTFEPFRKKKTEDLPTSIELADEALADRDPISALEILLPHANKANKHYSLSLRIGQAYEALNLIENSERYYEFASTIRPKSKEPYWGNLLNSIRSKSPESALLIIEKLNEMNDKRIQEIAYYQGIAYNMAKNSSKGKQALGVAADLDNKPLLKASAKELLELQKVQRNYSLHLAIDYGYYSSPLKTNLLPNSVISRNSFGVSTSGMIDWIIQKDRYKEFHLYFYFNQISYEARDLGFYSTREIILGFPIIGNLFDNYKSYRRFGIIPEVILRNNGNTRTADGLGLSLIWHEKNMAFSPEIVLTNQQFLDPTPAQERSIDPFSGLLVTARDRSARIWKLGIRFQLQSNFQTQSIAKIALENTDYRFKLSQTDDYFRASLGWEYSTYFLSTINLLASLGIAQYSFPNDTLRTDQLTQASFAFHWYIYPAWYTGIAAKFENRSSNGTNTETESFSYNQKVVSLTTGITL